MSKTLTILILSLFLLAVAEGQIPFRVMSYNVENLFDTEDNPATNDDEFLPSGNRRWTKGRYYHKLQQIAKVITAAGEWDTPALVGLCEVENDTVLTHLLRRTPLRQQHYQYCISQTSDRRGINMALLYQRDKFRYINHRSVPVKHKKNESHAAREILYVWGEVISGDTLDVMVCHFPSKYGGEKESQSRRVEAAKAVRNVCDSLIKVRTYPLILLMGDFNDPPESRCMQWLIGDDFTNLFTGKGGSHKYQGEWSQLDQIVVHRNLTKPDSRMKVVEESARNYSPSFLFIKDKTWRGERPFRTYHGFKYEGGYSDHLPVLADFFVYLCEDQ
ncbi:endonuclease/exonuclease/phosphatase family metal-dependent hydrolase [Parabacteroides sp. PF5-5]|uniref:endonuclease/exonuclease/phosphatase family protein n=1 Tax=unclassified Parabacteroides TaxID=2649774 RepID=UPI002473EF89|nr:MULTISPECIES: endonuclease [unclassified Parabacteroides]MDH6305106.1 endonuclease/exonuclease/phosphatase family metal-dependent hydrolase [Parabacteroides sp. PH5-39]MDH6316456.1 endonuclease/exonuclease/phosphatase family metal-dependent hydrolase [Parabacteroides sp. PF5-13]MDH6319966.1 endonuclease/exonuclease/phosphatase family metal-dependent hydrolase [Parabacteroides sp. PH5-13]MDH6323801.1 endonuclease/exonuclease/phosphatase family metal-dependent hydrolase [Parabacteroides sp. PH